MQRAGPDVCGGGTGRTGARRRALRRVIVCKAEGQLLYYGVLLSYERRRPERRVPCQTEHTEKPQRAHRRAEGPARGFGTVWTGRGRGCVSATREDSRWRKPSGGDLRRSCDCCASLCSAWTTSSRCCVAWTDTRKRPGVQSGTCIRHLKGGGGASSPVIIISPPALLAAARHLPFVFGLASWAEFDGRILKCDGLKHHLAATLQIKWKKKKKRQNHQMT